MTDDDETKTIFDFFIEYFSKNVVLVSLCSSVCILDRPNRMIPKISGLTNC